MSEEACLIDWEQGLYNHCSTHKRTILECAHAFRRLVTHERAEHDAFLNDLLPRLQELKGNVAQLRAERDLFQYLTRELSAKVLEQRQQLESELRQEDFDEAIIDALEDQRNELDNEVQHLRQENAELRAMLTETARNVFDWLRANPSVPVEVRDGGAEAIINPSVINCHREPMEAYDVAELARELQQIEEGQRKADECCPDPRPTDKGGDHSSDIGGNG